MENSPADPEKLLTLWNEWERGEVTPGRMVANLKTHGLPDILERLVQEKKASEG